MIDVIVSAIVIILVFFVSFGLLFSIINLFTKSHLKRAAMRISRRRK